MEKGRESLEYEMHIEALQNARNTIAIVAVLIASVTYAGGINPPGGVYQDGPWKGKSTVWVRRLRLKSLRYATTSHCSRP